VSGWVQGLFGYTGRTYSTIKYAKLLSIRLSMNFFRITNCTDQHWGRISKTWTHFSLVRTHIHILLLSPDCVRTQGHLLHEMAVGRELTTAAITDIKALVNECSDDVIEVNRFLTSLTSLAVYSPSLIPAARLHLLQPRVTRAVARRSSLPLLRFFKPSTSHCVQAQVHAHKFFSKVRLRELESFTPRPVRMVVFVS
jgi:hypothetical protein